MKSILAAVLITACLVGSATEAPADDAAPPALTAVVTGYSSKDNFVTLMNGEAPVSSLPPPNDADRQYVAQVSKPIRNDVIAFIAQPKTTFTIVAARPYGRILLLDVAPKGKYDGNTHVVYDIKREIVVGRFTWYVQG
jgi:hypothetical protein